MEGLKRDLCTLLPDHGTTVTKIVAAGFPAKDADFRVGISLWKFRESVNHAGLQRSFLSMQVPRVEEAITAPRGQLCHTSDEEAEVEVAAKHPSLQLQLGATSTGYICSPHGETAKVSQRNNPARTPI